jgi:hypothetical protein
MRPVLRLVGLAFALVFGVLVAGGLTAACGFEQLIDTGGGNKAEAGTSSEGGSSADSGPAVKGDACGIERNTGTTLCRVTSMCPKVVVDPQAFPDCGFRIRGSAVDLVCGCGTSICPMGIFTTCAQATSLLASQTQGQVCTQLAEGRCNEVPSSSSSGSTSSSGGSSACDKQCMHECGGGPGCASLCNCS